MVKKHKKSEQEVRREIAQLKEEIEKLRQRAQELGQSFWSLDADELARKVRGETSKSPFIFAQGWTSAAFPGSNASYNVSVRNPDPIGYSRIFATIFFGLGDFFSADQAWIGRDTRWPAVSSDRTTFLANTSQTFSFTYPLPSLLLGTYNGNSLIWQSDWGGHGTLFDRASFEVKLF